MARDPVLASKLYTEGERTLRMIVYGGLNYLRGNSQPHFAITADIDVKKSGERFYEYMGGCCHDEIRTQFPGRFDDLIAMHLSYLDGRPMHAESNGWYDLAGALGGMGQEYHVGNSKRNMPAPPPADKPWLDYEHRFPTPAECLQFFAEHCRISIEEARSIGDAVKLELGQPNEAHDAPAYSKADYKRARAKWAQICESMRPRWKAEADACIARHSLVIFGDEWAPERLTA